MGSDVKVLPCPFCGSAPKVLPRGVVGIKCTCGGTSFVQHCARTEAEAIIAWNRRTPTPTAPSEGGAGCGAGEVDWPRTCDGKEQHAFEAWASANGYDMHEHPLHYLFMDHKTDAARQAWKAGLTYAVEVMQPLVERALAAPSSAPAQGEVRDEADALGRIAGYLGIIVEHAGHIAVEGSMPDGERPCTVADLANAVSERIRDLRSLPTSAQGEVWREAARNAADVLRRSLTDGDWCQDWSARRSAVRDLERALSAPAQGEVHSLWRHPKHGERAASRIEKRWYLAGMSWWIDPETEGSGWERLSTPAPASEAVPECECSDPGSSYCRCHRNAGHRALTPPSEAAGKGGEK
jgi:hypothetical protein